MWIPVIVLALLLGGAIGLVVMFRRLDPDRLLAYRAATAVFQQWLHGMGGAFQEAAAILEGEGSLLWLLILVVILILAQ